MRLSLGPAGSPLARPWWRSEAAVIGSVALVVVALHLATNALYGFHRDELYYLDSARHLALGYVDYPP
jgi:hypothetical protein